MDWVTIVGLRDVGPWGLVAIFVLCLGFGWLIPLRFHRERIADYKDRCKEKDEAIKFYRTALESRDAQVTQLADNNQLAVNALEAIRREVVRA